MGEGGSLINLDSLSKPATVLIQKICNAVGVIYEPTRIKRQARAEAEAAKIEALGRIERNKLERRTVERLIHQEARKQENIEQIAAQAAAALPNDSKVECLDEDWIAHFFKQCDTVSDNEMQSLWARLLAGEASSPGTFSKRTVDFVSTIDKTDAALFTTLCQFIWVMDRFVPLIYDVQNDIYAKTGINFGTLKHLDDIGLISFESVSGYTRRALGKYLQTSYYGRPTALEFPSDTGNELDIGHTMLTAVGRELAPICGSVKNEEFYMYVIGKWFQNGVIPLSLFAPVPRPT